MQKQKKRKTIIILFSCLGALVLISLVCFGSIYCAFRNYGSNHRTNYFLEGKFSGVNSYNSDEVFYLTVTNISKEEYSAANGKNVVKDEYKKKYFSLDLYYLAGNNDEKNYLTFSNLNHFGTPISYIDDSGNYITPMIMDSDALFDSKNCIYNLILNYKPDSDSHAFVYMYFK